MRPSAEKVDIMFKGGLGYVPEDYAFSNEAQVRYELQRFYDTFLRLQQTHARVLRLGGSGLLDRSVYDRQRTILGEFWQLYEKHGWKAALTPDQQTQVVSWFTWGNTQLILSSKNLLGFLPLPIVVALVVGGVAVSIGVTYVALTTLSGYKSNISAQEKELSYRESILDRLGRGEVALADAKELIKTAPKVTASSGGGIMDILGRNVTLIALVLGGGLILTMLKK